ncbi:MAG TPA: hypothetical protein VGU66_06160 [Candidatus Elarobacter sp.]|nr:hypothetical protein [Candidatus Elarobacter sp.]
MNDRLSDDLAAEVRTAVMHAATAGLAAFGAAAALVLGEMATSSFVSGHATAGGDALAHELTTAFATDLLGYVAADLDADGLRVGGARVNTHLVAFASGEAASPVDDVSAERVFPFELGGVAALEIAATLTLKATSGFDATTRQPKKPQTSTKISLELGWAAEPRAEA